MRYVELEYGVNLALHDPGESISDIITREQNYFEIEILEYIKEHYPKHKTILDVGANIGNHAVYFARNLYFDTLIAFEPVKANYDLLVENLKPYWYTKTRRVAIGDGDLEVKMKIHPENMGACEITPTGTEKVQQIRLDDLLIDKVTLIKIDVEWYEPFVLLGAKNLIETDKPLILIEDSKGEYGKLLPESYHLIKNWPEHGTYLYGT